MTKRILAFTLCIVMLCTALASCAKKADNDPGAYITMYLTDDIYDFDPANAFYNSDASKVLSMMYDTLFKLNNKGKVEKSLVESYKIVENPESNEYFIEFKLKEAYWSVKDPVSAEDVVFAWSRLLDSNSDYAAASLLFDIKNARAVKEGDLTVSYLGVEAVEDRVVKVIFDKPIDYDQFFLNLTHVSTAPLLRRYVSVNPDWAKKNSTIATSGPFKLGKISYAETGDTAYDNNAIDKSGNAVSSSKNKVMKVSSFYMERNVYYYRDTERDALDASVTPYRLLVDCSKTAEEMLQDYQNGKLFYIGSIPLSVRNTDLVKNEAKVSNALSTFTCYLNQNALIDDGASGSYLFADAKVRQALSMSLNRQAIAEAVVFAQAASALVPTGVFEKGNTGDFSTSALSTYKLASNPQVDAAKTLLADAGITPAKYSFSIKVAAYDEVHVAIAELVCQTWKEELGFNVTVEQVAPIQNNDYFEQTDSVPPDVCDDLFIEHIQSGNFDVVAMDMTAFTADAYSVLANYAYGFSGNMYIYTDLNTEIYEYNTNLTGYDSVSYNILMESIYYLPYFASLEAMKNADAKTDPYQVTHINTQPYVLSAQTALRKLTDATTAAKNASEQLASILAEVTNANKTLTAEEVEVLAKQILDVVSALEIAGKQAVKNVVAAQASEELTSASQTASQTLTNTASNLLSASTLNSAVKKALDSEDNFKTVNRKTSSTDEEKKAAKEQAEADLAAAIAELGNTLTAVQSALTTADAAVAGIEAVKNGASTQTLAEAIQAVYTENGIVPSAKKSDWAAQRTKLLHKAEELLMKDMPVIPVVFNQDAVLVNSEYLKKVSTTYYAPAYFRKTKMKDYADYYYYDEAEEKDISIFKNFPEILWEKVGK